LNVEGLKSHFEDEDEDEEDCPDVKYFCRFAAGL
jgi:hypothetical protein